MNSKRQGWVRLVVLVGFPFLVRCGLGAVWRHSFTWGDSLFYAAIVEQWFQFGHAHDYLLLFPPGYPIVTLLFRHIFSLDRSLVLVSLLAGSLTPWLVWWIAAQTVGYRVAWYAWALTSCSPLLSGLSLERLADSLFIALVAAGLGAMVMFLRRRRFAWLLAFSLFCAASVQVKPEGLIFAAIQSAVLLLFTSMRPLRRLSAVGVLWLTIVLMGLPYWIFLYQQSGALLLSGKAPLNLLHARAKAETRDHSEELRLVYSRAFSLDESGRLAFLTQRRGFLDYLLSDPARALRVYQRNLSEGLIVLSPAALPLVLAAGLGCTRLRVWRERVFLALLASPLVLLLFPPLFVSLAQPSFHPGRLAGPVVPSLAVFAAVGIDRIEKLAPGRRVGLWIVLAWCLGCLVYAGDQTRRLDKANRVERRWIDLHRERVSAWLAANTHEDATIASTNLLDDVYGGRRSVWLPWEESPRLVDYLRSRKVNWVLQERGGGTYSPGLEKIGVGPESLGLEAVDSLDTVPPVVIYHVGPEPRQLR